MKKTANQIMSEINDLHEKWELALLDSAGEVTEQVEQIEQMIAESETTAIEKLEAYQHVFHKNDALLSSLQAYAEAHIRRAEIFNKAISALKKKEEYLEFKSLGLVKAALGDKDKILVNGRSVYISKYESVAKPANPEVTFQILGDYRVMLFSDTRGVSDEELSGLGELIKASTTYKVDAKVAKALLGTSNESLSGWLHTNGFFISTSEKVRGLK